MTTSYLVNIVQTPFVVQGNQGTNVHGSEKKEISLRANVRTEQQLTLEERCKKNSPEEANHALQSHFGFPTLGLAQ